MKCFLLAVVLTTSILAETEEEFTIRAKSAFSGFAIS
jgi:hypothetical protein